MLLKQSRGCVGNVFQRRVVRREARAREFVVVARITLFKGASVGKPSTRSRFERSGVAFIASVTAARPETR